MAVEYLIGLCCLVVVVLWWFNEIWYVASVKRKSSSMKLKVPPGHMGFPFVGELYSLLWYFKILDRPDDFIDSKRHRYGDNVGMYRSHLYGAPSIIVCSPSLCKLFIGSSTDKFKREWPTKEVQGSNSATVLEGAHYGLIRNFLANSFNHPSGLSRLVQHVQPSLVTALESWSQCHKIKPFIQVKKLALDYMGKYVANFEAGEDIDYHEKLYWGIQQGLRAQPWNFPGTAYHYAFKCRKKLTNILRKELERRKQNNDAGLESPKDMMDSLMQMKDKEGTNLSDEEVLDNVLTSIHLSHAATAYVFTWALYLLANSPHVLEKIREENKEIARDKKNVYITCEDISKLKYTNKVIQEVIRMTNLSAFIFKRATDDLEFNGYIIPRGWKVILWLRYLHTDPGNFEDPMLFNPDRWDTRPKNGTYLPFGGGSNSCIGFMYVRISLAAFLHHFSIGYKCTLLNPNVVVKHLPHPLPEGLEVSITKI